MQLFEVIYKIKEKISFFYSFIWFKPQFNSFGKNSFIKKPDQIFNSKQISIGNSVRIEKGAILYSVKEYAGVKYNGEIIISDGVYGNRFLNLTSAKRIYIGRNVAFGPNVFLNDFDHGYLDINMNMITSPLSIKNGIQINDDCWIGANVFITGNVTLGKHCVVAANSVVTKSFPDYSIIAGVPAKLIKFYDINKKEWIKVK